jgi:hypothetical protein
MRIARNHGLGRLVPVAATGALALTIVACGGSAPAPVAPSIGAPTTVDATTTPVDPGLPSVAPSTATVTTVDVGKEAWFAGFHVTFGRATAEIKAGRGGTVKVDATLENTGSDGARLDATVNLVSGGETADEGFDQDIPSVPGGSTGKGTFAFDVEDTFTFDDAVLTLGLPDNQQAVVPLKAAGEAVTREPVKLTISGSGKAGDLQLDLAGGELRADTPWKHGQQKKGTLVLTIDYSASFKSGFAGGFALTAENVALKLPDGTVVGTIQDGQSQSNELIGPNSTKKGLLSRFEISDPAAGSYTLLVRSFGKEAEIPVTIN